MKNTWLHSTVIAGLASILLAMAQASVVPCMHYLSSWFANQQTAMAMFSEPAEVFATLVPALLLGWFTRRHPLLVGAAAGMAGVLLANRFSPDAAVEAYHQTGDIIASAMTVAVAALAGRALRYRFRPESVPASNAAPD